MTGKTSHQPQEEELRIQRQTAFASDITLLKQCESRLRESEELFHIQVEGVKDYAIFMLDAEGNVQNWNAGAERLKGYRDGEIIGRHFSCFYPAEERKAGIPEEELKKAAAEGRVVGEGWRVRKGGSRFWADVIITALHDENGNLRGFSKVTHDISRRKEADDALRFSEARYRSLFRDNPTMIFTLDSDWKVLSANPFSARQLGYAIDELEGRSMLTVFHEDDRPAVIEQLRNCLRNPDQVFHWHFRKVRKDGGLLWVEETAQAIYGLNGELNVLVVCQDITERKHAEEEREQLLIQLDSVLNSINEGVIIADLEGNVLSMNPSALAIHGYESVEQVRRQLRLYQDTFELSDLDGGAVPFEQWPLARAIRGERFTDHEVSVRRKDTGKLWIGNYSGRPVQTKSGDTILSVVTLRDITERKQAEAEILRLASFPQMNPNPILEMDANGQITFCNPAAQQILGNAVSNNSISPLIPQDMPAILQCLRDGKVSQFRRETEINNRFFEELIYIAPPFHSVRIYTMDITDRKRMEEEIERLNTSLAARATELEAANKELEAFNYTVAHDLRKPLTVINSYAQVIKELCGNKLDEQCAGYLEEAYQGTLRMNRLIDALLNFSRLAHVELRREPVDLSSMAQSIATELKFAEPGRLLEFRIADGINADGDAALLQVVMENLLGNAWKYTGSREEPVIEFGATDIDGKPVYFVRDNGTGFDMADADKLFAAFHRLPGADEFKGFGIGLATVERIIRRHGGRVWAEGEPGKGATFWFTLQ